MAEEKKGYQAIMKSRPSKKKQWQDAADRHSKFWEEEQKKLHERNKRALEKAKAEMKRRRTILK